MKNIINPNYTRKSYQTWGDGASTRGGGATRIGKVPTSAVGQMGVPKSARTGGPGGRPEMNFLGGMGVLEFGNFVALVPCQGTTFTISTTFIFIILRLFCERQKLKSEMLWAIWT